MNVYWHEQAETDVPTDNRWLSSREAACSDGFRFAKRRADWRLGRWTAKRAVALCLGLAADPPVLGSIEIRPAQSGAPEVLITNAPAPFAISLSHRAGRGLCTLAPPLVRLGCDLEAIEAHSNAFIADYFTPEEQQVVACAPASERQRLLAVLWSAKESVLKSLGEGLRLDTRTVTVRFDSESPLKERWAPFHVRYGDQAFHGWWQQAHDLVRTVISDPPSSTPVPVPLEMSSGPLNKIFESQPGMNEPPEQSFCRHFRRS
jgi:4'-phosphopantetheinyl transferase